MPFPLPKNFTLTLFLGVATRVKTHIDQRQNTMIADSQNDKKNKAQLVKFRIDETDKKLIQERAEKVGKSVSEYCRLSALEKQILSFSDEEKKQLRGLSRNLNQALVFLYSEPSNARTNEQLISEVRKSLNFLSKLRKKW